MTEIATNGFGLAHIKREGCAAHPDHYESGDMSDAWYVRQAIAYMKDTEDYGTFFIRQELITEEMRKS